LRCDANQADVSGIQAVTPTRDYPGLAPLAARLAELHGLRRILVIGRLAVAEAAIDHPALEFIDVRLDEDGPEAPPDPGFHRRIVWRPSTEGLGNLKPGAVSSSVVACAFDGGDVDAASMLAALRPLLERATVTIIAAGDPGSREHVDLGAALATIGMSPTFVGRTERVGPEDATVVILDRIVGHQVERAPDDFRVVAIMSAYNEEDVIGPTIQALVDDRIDVYLIDNWSTDRTHEIAETFTGRGLIALERFPEAPSPVFDLSGLLGRVEAIAAQNPSRWFIHHDADERREGPWPGHSLRDALWAVDRAGFNAVDHTVLNFRPIDDGFVPGTDFVRYFRRFEFGDTPDMLNQVKAWKDVGGPVSLAATGGHQVAFSGRRIFPYKFLLKHYPVRSQAHGERKVLVERRGRWSPTERARGWHGHYDAITETHNFVRTASDLHEFVDGETHRDYLLPMVAGVGLVASGVPEWAVRSRTSVRVYRFVRRVAEVKHWLRHAVLPRVPLARRIARRLRLVGPHWRS
jgi:hypothetical protein